ncbi:MAG: hypothetical protein QM490_01855 [Candidatus Gracilibacteria bacterium]
MKTNFLFDFEKEEKIKVSFTLDSDIKKTLKDFSKKTKYSISKIIEAILEKPINDNVFEDVETVNKYLKSYEVKLNSLINKEVKEQMSITMKKSIKEVLNDFSKQNKKPLSMLLNAFLKKAIEDNVLESAESLKAFVVKG